METKLSFVKYLLVGVIVGMVVLGEGCGGLIKVGTAKDATPPAVRFTTRPESGVVPVAVRFDASATSDSESLISSYSWDFDGDGKEDSTAQAATFIYQQPGVYYPRLKVVNSEGLISYSTGSEIVANDKVYIRIETDKEVYKIGEDIKMSFTMVNTNNEDKILNIGCGWPTHKVVIYNVDDEAVWKYHDMTVSDSCPMGYKLKPKIPANGEVNFCSTTYTCRNTWHQNYGYEDPVQYYVLKKRFPYSKIDGFYDYEGSEIDGFYEYKGDVEKLRNQMQVLSGLYILKIKIFQGYREDFWGFNKIEIKGDF